MFYKLFVISALVAVCSAQRLPISVYYESLCPDSGRFITEQLHPVMRSPLGKYIDLTLVPFGKASYETFGSDVNFTCQHGPAECYGNKVHSCALQHIQVDSYQNTQTRETLSLDYVACLLKNALSAPKEAPFPGLHCARLLQLKNWDVIAQCSNTTEGSKLLQHNGESTQQLKPELTNVPWIVFNQQYEPDYQQLALGDLRLAVCRTIREPKPYECNNIPGSAPNNQIVGTIVVLSAATAILAKLF